MKKYLSLLLVALMVLVFLASCSESQNDNNANFSDNGAIQDSTRPSDTTDDSSTTDNTAEISVFSKNEKGNLVNEKGIEYEFLAGEAFLECIGELEFVGSVKGEEEFTSHLDGLFKNGMYAIKGAENDNILIRQVPNSEWRAIYRKSSLPKMDYSLENSIRLEFISEVYNMSDSHVTCGEGVVDKSTILSFLEDVKAQKSPEEAGLYDLVKQPNGMLENCYVCGAICAFFEEEPNLAVKMNITSYNDLAYSISIENKSYVLPTKWFKAIQNADKINTVTWQFDYAYWDYYETLTGETNTELLVDGGILGGDFDGIVIPKDITAGDTITINYTGSYTVLETYPSHIGLNGEVISYSFSYTNVIPIFAENLTEEMLLEYDAPNNYVILDRGGRFTTLDKYEGETVYLVEDQRELRQRTEDTPFYVACILAYNPRDLEDGVPDYENISESEAREIAHSHYYNNYFLTYAENFEYEMSQPENLEGFWEIRITEYRDYGYVYSYTIDKITGEIVSMATIDSNA